MDSRDAFHLSMSKTEFPLQHLSYALSISGITNPRQASTHFPYPLTSCRFPSRPWRLNHPPKSDSLVQTKGGRLAGSSSHTGVIGIKVATISLECGSRRSDGGYLRETPD